MQNNSIIQRLEVRNQDVVLRFTCPNYSKRIEECVANLCITDSLPDTLARQYAFYRANDDTTQFRLGTFDNEDEGWNTHFEIHDWKAFFFENTDYPLHAKALSDNIQLQSLCIGKEANPRVDAEDSIVFGSINYKNQVGRTDISLHYLKDGQPKQLSFSTEVLSYKMDYRTDMRNVIRDIENEFAMLSYSFLKETYLTFSQSSSEPTDLIWWQIFRDCFAKISEAARMIIDNPKRRLKSSVRYERAERMPYMPAELENEFEEFKDEPAHLYRMEEMFLSKDTIENRFLKYAITSIYDRFKRVKANIERTVKIDTLPIEQEINRMEEELSSLSNDPFFKGIGTFRGFTQDSLVMKQAAGYRDIYEQWIILQCGYDLQEGIMQLEVKDISELYEIWCFLKVKDIVEHILRGKAIVHVGKSQTEGELVKSLVQGSKSEVTFLECDNPEIQLASLMYNATTDDEEHLNDESHNSKNTDIDETTSITTEQRPDIVLRLSKTDKRIQYTYLFDAKYRLRDTTIGGVEVPPVDAINQLHRYRDAIYYTKSDDTQLKREVIGGYVLYPGNLSKDQFEGSYYHHSIDEVNIGAFPLKPGGQWKAQSDELLLDPTSSEDVLYQQIKTWLEDDNAPKTLLESAIPQKGLSYETEDKACFLLSTIGEIRLGVNVSGNVFKDGKATIFNAGHDPDENIDVLNIKYFAPIIGENTIRGYYDVTKISLVKLDIPSLEQPYRIQYQLGEYHLLPNEIIFGIHRLAAKGIAARWSDIRKALNANDKILRLQ